MHRDWPIKTENYIPRLASAEIGRPLVEWQSNAPLSQDELAKLQHDFIALARTLKTAGEQLAEGYRFDDEWGTAKCQALTKALHEASNLISKLGEASQ